MKKRILFLLIALIISNLFLISFVKAEAPPMPNLPFVNTQKVENYQGIITNLTDDDLRTQYLKQEWTKILEKSQIGKIIIKLGDYLSSLNILFIVFIGIGYSLSWLFFLSLLAWIIIIILIYKPVKSIFQLNPWLTLGIVLIVTALGAGLKAIPTGISFFTPLLSNIWIILFAIIISVILIYLYAKFFNTIERVIRERTKKETEVRQSEKSKTLEKITDIKRKGA